ncbi:hypothetical protein [Modestobacter sp. URMC 112]
MASNQPDPGEFLEMAQRMLRQMFGEQRGGDDPWAEATRRPRTGAGSPTGDLEPTPERQRENLTFALATRAVEALEDLALNVAAIRQRLERTDPGAPRPRPGDAGDEGRGPDGADAAGQ